MKLGGNLPKRTSYAKPIKKPAKDIFENMFQSSGSREMSTTMALVRMLTNLLRDKNIAPKLVPIIPDEARTFGMEGFFQKIGIYAHEGQKYEPEDSEQLSFYREDRKGQVLEEGITEAGAMSSWIAAGTAYTNHDLEMIPIYMFYSMFGFQRVMDLAWAAGDSQTRGFLIGATSGRTTLAGEGLQHQDGHSHLLASTIPNCTSYDPTFAYELAVILRDGLKRMHDNQENIFYYITVMNENYKHPKIIADSQKGIIKGMYLFKEFSNSNKGKIKIQLLGCGAILREMLGAAEILCKDYNVDSDVWSVTSFNELRRDGMETERKNLLNPGEKPEKSYVQKCLGIRGFVSINVQTGEVLDTHSFAVLLGVGATTINPYLVFDSIYQRYKKKLFGKFSYEKCIKRYIKSVDNGLLKIMSKMGISVLSSYRGGCNFETVGLSRAIVSEYFPGTISRISGIGIFGIQKKIKKLHKKAFQKNVSILPIGGIYKYRKNGESHQYQGQLIHMLQHAVTTNSYETYKKYAQGIYDLPTINLRDLLAFKYLGKRININKVESVESLRKRFGSGSMSHGALSKEAHETLAIAMNRIGAASCSGEGGEDSKRFVKMKNGDSANSSVKQIASARFGVTIEYLNNCNEIEIKIAQGAKPGEGGQLPGFKVSKEIAKLRYSTPGVTLISPPPHHDIYSIEDLAQLIYDLKQTNPNARVGVKLVASTGIGTIAAGVAKAKADVILISGHSGGTGASPQTSIKHVGIPWEMGLTEANQILTLNGLRHQVTLRTDGGIKTGRDVVIAAMMGAEEFGIGTTSLVAMGCIMVRQCHSNTCPVGVCTQDTNLIKKFTGTPEKVVNLFTFIAHEVREILAELGFKNLNEIIGRTDLLKQVSLGTSNLDDLDLNPLLVQADPGGNKRYCTSNLINKVPPTLDEKIYEDIKNSITKKNNVRSSYEIKNIHRAVGTRLSHYIFKKFGKAGIKENTVEINLSGSAGQSLGAFGIKGLKLNVTGDANDYVGKGLSGATIVIKPPIESNLVSNENTIVGNTVLYGATSGKLFAAGQSGERFAVRNSGVEAVIEGCDSNGCEYMTGGIVVILGKVGDNFAAGMTGGMVFIYDPNQEFENYVNPNSVIWQIPETDYWKNYLKNLINEHFKETKSKIAQKILENFNDEVKNFKQVCPKEMLDKLLNPLSLQTKVLKAI